MAEERTSTVPRYQHTLSLVFGCSSAVSVCCTGSSTIDSREPSASVPQKVPVDCSRGGVKFQAQAADDHRLPVERVCCRARGVERVQVTAAEELWRERTIV
jgi:hypothetical protein